MLTAVLGVVAALAFVLGLGALCLWALKRWGSMSLTSRTRIAVEVVQRIPLGPKTGLAVVRVGEKVMAVSVGDGGIRTLFELDEADRQRVIASSQVPVPMESSAEASASLASFMPSISGALMPGAFGRSMAKAMAAHREHQAPMASASSDVLGSTSTSVPIVSTPLTTMPAAPAVMSFRADEPREIPSFLTAPMSTRSGKPLSYGPPVAPRTAANSEREFRAMLGGAFRGATRLAVFTGAMILATVAAAPLRAQAAPPVTPPVAQPVAQPSTPATTPATNPNAQPAIAAPTTAPTVTPASTANAPATLPLPSLQMPTPPNAATQTVGATPGQNPTLSAPVAPKAPLLPPTVRAARATRPAAPPKTGNGASVAPNGTTSRRPMSQMQLDSAANATGDARANAAQPAPIAADDAIMRMMPQMDIQLGDEKDGGLRLNGTVGIVVMMGLLTLLPTLLLMMTGFTRILIVLHFLKQAMGTQSAPPAQLLAGMALLLTGFVMAPTLREVNDRAITPWLDGKITQVEMMKTGVEPMREFMLKQTRESDLKTFVEMSKLPRPNTAADVPLHVLMSAFVASELRTAFQIGFAIYLPFIIIDAVVASVLMSMGMFMLPPAMISLPFKLLLFVLVDGWSLTISSLVAELQVGAV